ncbi:hypothetical protein [Amycolatopsis sp. lyj-109]|uniref:hypothetical protein n=1 Tax=Amycolatopsis sp. lyj-109 TaxID=2789287 RepID=UPI00397825BB
MRGELEDRRPGWDGERAAYLARAAAKADSFEEQAGRRAATAGRAFAEAEAARQRAEKLQTQTWARLRPAPPAR